MPESQVLLSVGIPTIAVLVGILINNRQLERLERHVDAQSISLRAEISSLRSEMIARFEAAHQALLRVEGIMDARLKQLENRD
jgi:hypothetical protein